MSRKSDDFVARLVQDPGDPPDLLLLSGYLGASSEEGHVRLYLDEELSRYAEIPKEAIRHARELSPEQSPLGGSLLWIDRDADLMHGRAGAKPGAATFLEGWIADEYNEVAAAVPPKQHAARAVVAPVQTQHDRCPPTADACPTRAGCSGSMYYDCFTYYQTPSTASYACYVDARTQTYQKQARFYFCGGGSYITTFRPY